MIRWLSRGARALPAGVVDLVALTSAAPLRARREGHAAACRALLGAADGIDHGAAVRAHVRFVLEVLAELAEEGPAAGAVSDGAVSDGSVGGPIPPPRDRRTASSSLPLGVAPTAAGGPGPRGTLVVTVHRGNWIVGARLLAGRLGPVETVAGTQFRSAWRSGVERSLLGRGVRVLPPGRSLRRLRRALEHGGTVVLHLDGDPYPAGAARWRRRTVPPGVRAAAALAAATGAEVRSVLCLRDASGAYGIVERELAPAGAPAAGPRERIAAWESVLRRELHERVAEDPGGWLVFRDAHLLSVS